MYCMRYLIYSCLWAYIVLLADFAECMSDDDVVADLSSTVINVDSQFDGADLLLFGKLNNDQDVIVTIRGPPKSYVVRKKSRRSGIWMYSSDFSVKDIDSFYYIASTKPLSQFNDHFDLQSLHVGIDSVLPADGFSDETLEKNAHFFDAFKDIKIKLGLYKDSMESGIVVKSNSLFRANIDFPSNVSLGKYVARIFLFRNNVLQSVQLMHITVENRGFSALIYKLAMEKPYFYAFLVLGITFFIGWIASMTMRKV